jgi:aldehyde:ferredoxin oxidoreductase
VTLFGYYGKILHIDLTERRAWTEEPEERFWRTYAGGGLLAAYYLYHDCPPRIGAYDPANLLIMTSSVVAGHPHAGLARFTVAAKSPLTGGLGETRAEGPFGVALKGCGADALIFHGASEEPLVVLVEDGQATFHDASDVWGQSIQSAVDWLERQFGADIHTAAIGPAGENLVRFASIVSDRSYQAARMGLGAVMGSKGLKAVVLRGCADPGRRPPVADPAVCEEITRYYAERMRENSLTRWQLEPPGFSSWVHLHGLDASLCVRNYSDTAFPEADCYTPESFMTHYRHDGDCPGCPNQCIKFFDPFAAVDEESGTGDQALGTGGAEGVAPDGADWESAQPAVEEDGASEAPDALAQAVMEDGLIFDARGGGIHQEITGTLGPNLGIADMQTLFMANALCNNLGLDPTSLGFTLSMAMECVERGILPENLLGQYTNAEGVTFGIPLRFGRADALVPMIMQIAYRQEFGAVLAEGARHAAAHIGGGAEKFALHVKGLEMVCFEPRTQTNLALGYATAPIGPRYDICEHDWDFDTEVGWDHTLDSSRTLGILERVPMGYLGADKVRNFKALSTLWSAADALDFCIFAIAPTRALTLEHMARLLAAVTGWNTSSYEIMRYGERRLHLMRLYNLREGLTAADDMLPARFFDDPIPTGRWAGVRLDRKAFAGAVRTYYRMMGWDDEGRPRPETLIDHRLEWTL